MLLGEMPTSRPLKSTSGTLALKTGRTIIICKLSLNLRERFSLTNKWMAFIQKELSVNFLWIINILIIHTFLKYNIYMRKFISYSSLLTRVNNEQIAGRCVINYLYTNVPKIYYWIFFLVVNFLINSQTSKSF